MLEHSPMYVGQSVFGKFYVTLVLLQCLRSSDRKDICNTE